MSGWLERGAEIGLEVRLGGQLVSADEVVWSAGPATATEFLSGNRARLLEVGSLELTATVGDRSGSRTIDVVLPPQILFDDRVGGNRDIYMTRLDGSDLVRLTEDPADDSDPTAGGGWTVFSSLRDGNAELYALQDGMTGAQRLTETASDERQPALSRGGTQLAFARSEGGGNRIWTRPLGGGPEDRVTDGLLAESGIEASPSWDPQAERLVLMSTADGNADIWSVSADGAAASLVVGTAQAEVEPAWHPDEDRVVFAATIPGEDPELFLADLAEGTTTRLTTRPGTEGQPAWLPDGRIVFTIWTESGTGLMWLDPAEPDVAYSIPVSGPLPQNPTGVH
ncbi:MAG: PD40 domain-containing protein [Gemmatimonadales bacterium]|nr:MAG: PD40 domain-containing protein [Gemmatimonadales bacterium]